MKTVKEYKNKAGKYHREDGPAIEYEDGSKVWRFNGELHREDGPASEWSDGSKEWHLNGKLHREDGPASEWSDGYKEWWLNGIKYTEEEFKRKTAYLKTSVGRLLYEKG